MSSWWQSAFFKAHLRGENTSLIGVRSGVYGGTQMTLAQAPETR